MGRWRGVCVGWAGCLVWCAWCGCSEVLGPAGANRQQLRGTSRAPWPVRPSELQCTTVGQLVAACRTTVGFYCRTVGPGLRW